MRRHLHIGKSDSNDIILQGRYVSDDHAIIEIDQDKIYITDLGSTFGTHVNGERIKTKTQIFTRDKIKIGNLLIDLDSHLNQELKTTDEGIYFDDLFTSQGRISNGEYSFLLILIFASPIIIIGGVPVALRFLQYRLFADQYDLMIYNKPIWIISYLVIGFVLLLQTVKRIRTIKENRKVTEHNPQK
jgi:hypothetical protein